MTARQRIEVSLRGIVTAALVMLSTGALAASKESDAGRSSDCASPTRADDLRLSVAEARTVLNRQFSGEHAGPGPLAFEGLDYACVTSYRSDGLREVAVFGRDGVGDFRLFVTGDDDAAQLQDAINRLIHEASEKAASKKKTRPGPTKGARAQATPAPRSPAK